MKTQLTAEQIRYFQARDAMRARQETDPWVVVKRTHGQNGVEHSWEWNGSQEECERWATEQASAPHYRDCDVTFEAVTRSEAEYLFSGEG